MGGPCMIARAMSSTLSGIDSGVTLVTGHPRCGFKPAGFDALCSLLHLGQDTYEDQRHGWNTSSLP